VSYLVRAYAWKTILGTDGVLNTLLQYAHLTSHPLDFCSTALRRSTYIDAHLYAVHLPPHLRSLEHIPRNLVEASTISEPRPPKLSGA